jgi:hypothetical protein
LTKRNNRNPSKLFLERKVCSKEIIGRMTNNGGSLWKPKKAKGKHGLVLLPVIKWIKQW